MDLELPRERRYCQELHPAHPSETNSITNKLQTVAGFPLHLLVSSERKKEITHHALMSMVGMEDFTCVPLRFCGLGRGTLRAKERCIVYKTCDEQ
ncbi:hypothetical protein GW17_00000785 [Ensete ventricosum]|nr:hypothetical protein GW17_00000785 [Ensete ventricosum]RZR76664.1 hypothetical protein BHM03_00001525 [Ensete ventricosum]